MVGVARFERARLQRPLKKSKTQIPHRLKSVRDDKNKGLATAQLKLCPFKTLLKRLFQRPLKSCPDTNPIYEHPRTSVANAHDFWLCFSLRDLASTPSASFRLWPSSFFATASSYKPIICAARIPALVAPGLPMATVATGIPAGICTIASSESSPSSAVEGIGTAITGSVVSAAMTPARCAAPPAPAMTTFTPRALSPREYSLVRAGERCAEVMSIS